MSCASTSAPKVDLSKTFHRRELPAPSVQFSSDEGRVIFGQALAEGNMHNYFSLAETFQTQGAPAYCGLGSLSMVLNALLVDPKRVWQGVWRWFEDGMLDCCEDLEVVKQRGIVMSKLACLGRCQGATVEEHYADEGFTEAAFRRLVHRATRAQGQEQQEQQEGETGGNTNTNTNSGAGAGSGETQMMIASYDRKTLGQTGSGHFSPVGGYCAARDMVLIMDVARFKLPAHWAPLPLLFQALRKGDPDSGKPRGCLMVSTSTELELCCAEYCRASGAASSSSSPPCCAPAPAAPAPAAPAPASTAAASTAAAEADVGANLQAYLYTQRPPAGSSSSIRADVPLLTMTKLEAANIGTKRKRASQQGRKRIAKRNATKKTLANQEIE